MSAVFPVHLRLALPEIRFVEAKHYRRAGAPRSLVKWVVLHCTDTPEQGDRAERCAQYFAITDREASAHYATDQDSIVQCVAENRIAYGARGANQFGVHVEHAGLARQTREQWLDVAGVAMLDLSAQLVEGVCRRWSIPLRAIGHDELLAGERGITTHRECTEAFGGTHRDPGPEFPLELYLERVLAYRELRAGIGGVA
jgi:N-acetyl-anhydromuramyl-L-alanine amidase AmpD